jgi:phosphoribosyl 1,2-cyclic phosphate phosphodiesterase
MALTSQSSSPAVRSVDAKTHLKKQPQTIEFKGQMILLGTGTSVGVPAIGCGCRVCRSNHPRNMRSRSSAILGLPEGNLLIDTSPDLRQQLLREGIGIVHAVAYTHEHSDHLFGFDDLRLFQFYLGHPVPIYCTPQVEARLRSAFEYAFSDQEPTHVGAAPAVNVQTIGTAPFQVLGAEVLPVPLKHGPNFEVLGFRVGNVAYCTDVSEIPDKSMKLLMGLDALVLDALRPEPHITHLCIDQAIAIAMSLRPRQTYFTHCSCQVDYDELNAILPDNIAVGYDGLRIQLT